MEQREKQQCVYCKKFFVTIPGYSSDACVECVDDDYSDYDELEY